MAAAARAGSRRTAPASARTGSSATPRGSGTPAAASRRTCTAAPGWRRGRAGPGGPRRAQRERARVPRRERRRGRPRAARRAAGNRRLRALLAGAAVLLVVAIAGGGVSLVSRGNARDAESAAEAQALTSDAERVGALALTAPTLEQAMLSPSPPSSSRIASRRAEICSRCCSEPGGDPHPPAVGRDVPAMAISPDGRLLATGDDAGVVRFTDLRTWGPSGAPMRLPARSRHRRWRSRPTGGRSRWARGRATRSELHLVDVATRPDRRIGSWRGLVRNTPTDDVARLRARRAPARGQPGDDVADVLHARRRAAPAPRRPQRASGVAAPLPAPPRPVGGALRFRPDGALISSAQQGETLVWDARAGRIMRRFPIGGRFASRPTGAGSPSRSTARSPGEPSCPVALLDLRTGRHTELAAELPDEWITSLAFTRDGKRVVGAAGSGTHVWDIASGAIVETLWVRARRAARRRRTGPPRTGDRQPRRRQPQRVGSRRHAPLGHRFRWTREGHLRREPMHGGRSAGHADGDQPGRRDRRADRSAQQAAHRGAARRERRVRRGVAFTSDGRRLVTGGMPRTVTIWDVRSQRGRAPDALPEPVAAVAVSPDGRVCRPAAARGGRRESHVEVRDLSSDETVRTHTLRIGVGDLAFTRDGRVLVAGGCCSAASAVVGWDARSGARLFESPAGIQTFALSSDSRTIAGGTKDGRMLLWDLRSGRRLGPATKVTGGAVSQLSFSPDRRYSPSERSAPVRPSGMYARGRGSATSSRW